jgi:CRISPR-associated protein Cas1
MSQRGLFDRALALPTLRAAWKKVYANGGVAGADDVSIRRFARDWENHLTGLQRTVRENTYKPKRLRRFKLRKPDNGWRVISVPAVVDRILQRAVLNVLEMPIDRNFLDCSFGYRPRRGLQMAVDSIVVHRNAGLTWVLDADIDAFFDRLDHALLMMFLREEIADESILNLIALWLKTGQRNSQVGDCRAASRLAMTQTHRAVGVPLGSPISPLLSNVYLHRFDRVMVEAGWRVVRYADDFIVMGPTRAEIEEAQRYAAWALKQLRLKFHPKKTRVTCFEEGFDFLGVRFAGNSYSYLWQDKHVTVKGERDVWHFPFPPAGY